MLRRVLISLAFSTCCLLNFWIALAERRTVYFLQQNPARETLPIVITWQILLTAAMLAVWELGRERPRYRPMLEVLFLLACLFPAGFAAAELARISPFDLTSLLRARLLWPAAFAMAAAALWFAARRPALLRSLLLWSCPVLAVAVLEGTATMFRYRSVAYLDVPLAPRLPAAPRVRVVWIIFDELSQAVAFERRPGDLHLPNFDRLKQESFYASSAFAPAGATLLSLPSLILGEHVIRAEPDGPADLRLQTRERSGAFSWRSARNIFDAARDAGFNSAIVGWYHPYGRVLDRSLAECFWTPTGIEPGVEEDAGLSPLARMFERGWLQIAGLPAVGRFRVFSPRRFQSRVRIRDFEELRRRALQVSADPNIGLALLHLPVPHPPGIYDRTINKMATNSPGGYIDNIALADRTLGELRSKMEQAGLWDRTAVIVSADHGWRKNLWNGFPEWTRQEQAFASVDTSGVPFLVKLPREVAPVSCRKPFDTVITRKIVLEILDERMSNPTQLRDEIDASRLRSEY